ncbi:WD40-repeat-containing domain protein [Chlamydoabsidia padenii]|nr:WD40-repeat-containing domain protein [Chlamydoabsidia padenii]
MSETIQQSLWDRRLIPKYSTHRLGKELAKHEFVRKLYSDPYFMKRMESHKELKGHRGCVNTLHWSQQGDKLLSGSDDHDLRIWYPFEDDYEKKLVFKSGHRDNIFDAKFMPSTSDRILISAAGDGEVRIFDLEDLSTTNQLCHIYTCHSDPVKRICTEAYNPYEFLTCSEDATVRHFDLRQPHTCTPHNIRSFNSGIPRITRQYASQHRTVSPRPLRHGCPKPLLDYSLYGFDINCMTINQHRPHYFAIAGMDDYMYLHDRRMINGQIRSPGSHCVLRLTPADNLLRDQTKHYVTACQFSDSNGYELLGNWAGSGAYLFNIMDTPGDSSLWSSSTLSQPSNKHLRHCLQFEQQQSYSVSSSSLDDNPMTIPDDDDDDDDDDDTMAPRRHCNKDTCMLLTTNKERVIQALEKGDLTQALRLLDEYYIYLQHDSGNNESSMSHQSPQQRETTRLEHAWLHCMTAVVFAARSVQTIRQRGDSSINYGELAKDDIKASQVEILRAAEIAPKNWKGKWCLAITHWLIYSRSSSCSDLINRSLNNGASFFLILCHHLRKSKKYSAGVMKLLGKLAFTDLPGRRVKGKRLKLMINYFIIMFGLCCLAKSDCRSFSYSANGYLGSTQAPVSPPSATPSSPQASSSSSSTAISTLDKEESTDWLRLLYPSPSSSLETAVNTILSDEVKMCEDDGDDEDKFIIEAAKDCLTSLDYNDGNDESDEDGNKGDDTSDGNDTENSDDVDDNDDDSMDDEDDQISSDDDDALDYLALIMYAHSDDRDFTTDVKPADMEYHQRAIRREFESNTRVIGHRTKYTGHVNTRTIKGVNFYGAQDEYVVSGSDDGRAFIWNKKTGAIVQILEADHDTVNVIQGHPVFPYLAISGIDNTIKIFTPTNSTCYGSSSSSMDQVDDIIASNRETMESEPLEPFLTRSALENMARLYRQQYSSWIANDDD